MDGLIRARVARAAVLSTLPGGGLSVLLVMLVADETLRLACVLASLLLLAIARLLAVAGAATRAPRQLWAGPRQLLLELLAVAFCAFGAAMAAVAFGEENDSWVISLVFATAAELRQPGRYGLQWNLFPLQAVHRRVRAGAVGLLATSLATSCSCLLLGLLLFGSSGCGAFRPWLMAGMLVFSSVELQDILLQDCTSVLSAAPSTAELLEALGQPLGKPGPGLARWAALTSLAQAVAFEHKGHRFEAQPFGFGAQPQMPQLASEVFGYAGVPASSATPWTLPEKSGEVRGARFAENRGLFAVYLQSGLEVLREFTIRVQCLVASSWRRGAKALTASQLQVLEADVAELAPLMRIAAAGLSGWICLSRDLDERGVVQREEALSKVIYELCGSLRALERAVGLRGFVDLSGSISTALSSAREEARHSLYQLLLTFERCGLQQVVMPPLYKRMLDAVTA